MGYCSRCHKFMLFSSSGYCNECKTIIEAASREEERQINKEGFQNRTLSQKEYESLKPDLKKVYLCDPTQEEEVISFREAILSQPKPKIIEVYNQWAFGLFKKRAMCVFGKKREKTKDELEKQVYEKELKIIQSCISMSEFQPIMSQLPHCGEIVDRAPAYGSGYIITVYRDVQDFKHIKLPYVKYMYIDNENCYLGLLSREENLLFRAFKIFVYSEVNDWPYELPLLWNEHCDSVYNRCIEKRIKEAERQSSFVRFLATTDNSETVSTQKDEQQDTVKSDEPGTRCPVLTVDKETDPVKTEEVQETVKSDEPEADSPDTPDPGESIPVQKVKKPKKVDACNGNTRFTASWK